MRVMIVTLCFLTGLIAVGTYLVPSVIVQTKLFADNYTLYLNTVDEHLLQLSTKYPQVKNFIPVEWPEGQNVEQKNWSPSISLSEDFLHAVFGMNEGGAKNGYLKVFVGTIKKFGGKVVSGISAFFLSLLFSFLIVLDLPRLTAMVGALQHTKLRFFCREISESIFSFGCVLGHALEAQFFIAILNTIFTAISLFILGLKTKIAFLSIIVFICSFIPIMGVFISSIPICLLALQQGGVHLTLLAILFIVLIHIIEAYVLSPKIYGHHLHMNPVLVLIVLTMAGKLFGMWGLILALPVCYYIFGKAIR